jgi:hypothetical protein
MPVRKGHEKPCTYNFTLVNVSIGIGWDACCRLASSYLSVSLKHIRTIMSAGANKLVAGNSEISVSYLEWTEEGQHTPKYFIERYTLYGAFKSV